MLQFIASKSNQYSFEEQVKIVLDAGCKWIELHIDGATNEEAKSIIENIIPLCKESDTILIIDNYVELVKDLEVTGVRICKKGINVTNVRDILEGGPIIGINVATASDIYALKGIDVDYVALGAYETIGIDSYKKIVNEVHNAGIELPIVAYGDITIEDIDNIMATGVNGIAMSSAIVNAENPLEYTKAVLDKLYNK